MERRLYTAAVKEDINALHELLQEDPLVLDRVTLTCFNETPLHIAVMRGNVDFVKEILQLNPQLAMELDSRQSSPLHMASIKGNLEVNLDMCLARDVDGRNPLHLAAMKGRVEVLEVSVQKIPSAALERLYRDETILHLCVQQNQLKVLKMLVQALNDPQFVNAKDDDGNTVLHLAVINKQIKTINYLLFNTEIEVNAVNLYGLTAMDILSQSRRDVKDMDISQSLSRAAAVGAKDLPQDMDIQDARTSGQKHSFQDLRQQEDWLERKRNTLMVVASLIATMAFQAALSPPGGFWQDTKMYGEQNEYSFVEHYAGHSIWGTTNPLGYGRFLIFNTISFIASLSIILLLISGLPLRRRVFVWILMVIMWIAITAVAFTYTFSILAVLDWCDHQPRYELYIFLALMGLLLLGHLIRCIIRIIKALSKLLRRKRIESYNSV